MRPDNDLVAMAFKLTEEQFGQLAFTGFIRAVFARVIRLLIHVLEENSAWAGWCVCTPTIVGIDIAEAGDIVAMVGVDCASGDTFCGGDTRVACESIFVPDPVIHL